MKLKLKLNKRQIALAALAALAVFALLISRGAGSDDGTEDQGVLDSAANRACTDFADGYSRARTAAARLALADRVTTSSARSDNDAIAKRAAELGHNADESTSAWKASAAALTDACRNAGWKAT